MKRLFACFAAMVLVLCLVTVPRARATGTGEEDSTGTQSTPAGESMQGMKHEAQESKSEEKAEQKAEAAKTPAPKAHAAKKAVPKLDINSASKEALMKLPGIGEDTAEKIVEGRPYKTKGELLTKKLVTRAQYTKIRYKVIAKQAAAATTK